MLKRVLYVDGSPTENSEVMSDKDGKKRRKMAATSANCPILLDVEVVEIAESDEENDLVGGGGDTGQSHLQLSFSGGQQNLHAFLKTEIAKLCKALKLSEDIVRLIQRLLEYLVKNYDVNKGDTRHLRAFQMSLCWIAADMLGKKIDRKGSLLEARNILNFKCPEDLARSVYEKLTSEETIQQIYGKIIDSISSRNVASPLADIAVRSSDLQEPCMKAEVVEILDLEENQESRDKIEFAINQKKLRKVKKFCEERKLELRQKHEKKVLEFKKIWKERREKLLEEHTTEMADFNAIRSPGATKMNNIMEATSRYCEAIKDLESSEEWKHREMEKKHAAEMEEEKRKCEDLLAQAVKQYGSGGSTMTTGSNANDSTTGALPITIASDVVILDESANVETEVVGCGSPTYIEAVGMQVGIPVSTEQPDAAKVIVNDVQSANGDTKGDLASLGCHSGPLPDDTPSTVGMDPADCLKPVDLQSANATDNGTTEEHSVHSQPVALKGRHTMLHVSDDCHHSTDLREASVTDSQVDIGQSNTHVNIVDSADCDSRPDSHSAEEVDKMRAGEQSAGAHAQNLVCHAQVDENAGELNKQPVLENGEDGLLLSSDNATDTVDSHDSRHDSHTAEEVDKMRAGEQSAGAQAQNLVCHAQVDENAGELNKQPVLENGEDGMLLSSNNATDAVDSLDSRHDSDTAGEADKIRADEQSAGAQAQNLVSPIQVDESVGELHKQSVFESVGEPGEPFDSSQNHALSDVAGNAAELQNAAVLLNGSNLVSAEADSHDLPPVSGIDHELNGEQFVGFQNPESISGVAANTVFPLPPHPHFASLLADPLQRDIIKRCNEKQQVDKLHEDTVSQLIAGREKEIQEMDAQTRVEYTKKIRDAESSCTVKKTEFEAKHRMLVLNRFLANTFESKCRYFISSGSSDVVQPGAPSGVLHQQQFVSSSQSSLRHSPVASSSPLGQPATINPVAPPRFMQQQQLLSSQPSLRHSPVASYPIATVNPVYSIQRQPVVSLASSQLATIHQTNTPCAQFTPRSLNPSLTHSRPLQISTVTSTIGTGRVGGGSFVRAPAPHIQPFRPPSSSQPVRLGINSNHL